MKCAICHEETIGRDPVKWGPEFAHRTCVVAFDAGVDVERYRMRDIVKDDAHAMTFQSLGQYRSALIAALRSNVELRGRAAGEGPVERGGTNLSAGLGGADIGGSK